MIINLLDRSEDRILNTARRLIVAIILLLLVGAAIFFVTAAGNYMDSPNASMEDSIDTPNFEKPEIEKVIESKAKDATSSDAIQDNETVTDEPHPMPLYATEINEIIDDVMPLYVALWGYANDEKSRKAFVKTLVINLKIAEESLNDEKLDSYINGLVEYMDDWSGYYINEFKISDDMKAGKELTTSFEEQLKNPYKIYNQAFLLEFSKLKEEVKVAEAESFKNNMSAMKQIMIVGGALGSVILLILILLMFKVESSIRRQAVSLEKDVVTES